MRTRTVTTLCFIWFGLQGCASTLYQGEIVAPSSSGEDRRAILYWSKTRAFPWKAKAGPAVLLNECGTPVTFVERPEGIVFLGTPGQDQPVDGSPAGQEFRCGRIVGGERFVDLGEGPLDLTITCHPVEDDEGFGAIPGATGYLAARTEPYRFTISGERSWSLLGATPPAPAPPACLSP